MSHTGQVNTNTYTRSAAQSVAQDLKEILGPGSEILLDQKLASKTTLKVGGLADCFVKPGGENELGKLLHYCDANRVPWMMIGRGSNLLVRDGGVPGVVIQLTNPIFNRLEYLGPETIRCGAGCRLKAVANFARDNNIGGLEFLEGIPGAIGGALRMNAGALGVEIFDKVVSVTVAFPSGKIEEVPVQEIEYQYRSSSTISKCVAINCILKGSKDSKEAIQEKMKSSNKKRWQSQPAAPSAGCTFKNPTSIPAGKLIDELGLKGTSIGGACISDVHGNFMVNSGNATAAEFLELIEKVKADALNQKGLELDTEVQIVGEDSHD